MIDILAESARILKSAGFASKLVGVGGRQVVVFEDQTVVGFVLCYSTSEELVRDWGKDSQVVIAEHQFGLRRAGQKAWNTYLVLLALEGAREPHAAILSSIEEDLVGTRKIASAGVSDIGKLRNALLPMLPLQAAPLLGAVDISAEVRQRATELPSRIVDAFLSQAEEGIVFQILEDTL